MLRKTVMRSLHSTCGLVPHVYVYANKILEDDEIMYDDESTATATYLADIANVADKASEILDEHVELAYGIPQTVLQLLLQVYSDFGLYCNTGARVADCMLKADTRPVSEILDDAKKLVNSRRDGDVEFNFVEGLIGRLILKELQ